MFNNKLIALLRSFTKPELRQLEAYLSSAFSGSPAGSKELVQLLSAYYPAFDEKMPGKEWFFERLFPGQPYKDSRLRLLFSDTYAVTRRYAVHCLLETTPENEAVLFARYLHTRSVGELLETELGRAGKVLEQRALNNGQHHMHLWQLDYIRNDLLGQHYIQNGKLKEMEAGLKKSVHTLGRFYLAERLNDHIWRSAFMKEPLSPELRETYARISETLPEITDDLRILREVTELAGRLDDEKLLNRLLQFFHSEEVEKLDHMSFGHLFSILHNSCLRMTWAGKSDYQFEQHKLIKRLSLLGLFAHEGKVHTSMLCNFAQTCTIFGDVDFFEKLYAQCEKFIPKDIRSSTNHFCQAYLELSKRNTSAALRHLQSITHDSYRRRLFYKTILMRIYYERHEDESLLSLADTVRHFLPGAAMLHEAERDYNSRFITMLLRLVRLRDAPNKELLEKFLSDIAQRPSANWRWLKAKAEELLVK